MQLACAAPTCCHQLAPDELAAGRDGCAGAAAHHSAAQRGNQRHKLACRVQWTAGDAALGGSEAVAAKAQHWKTSPTRCATRRLACGRFQRTSQCSTVLHQQSPANARLAALACDAGVPQTLPRCILKRTQLGSGRCTRCSQCVNQALHILVCRRGAGGRSLAVAACWALCCRCHRRCCCRALRCLPHNLGPSVTLLLPESQGRPSGAACAGRHGDCLHNWQLGLHREQLRKGEGRLRNIAGWRQSSPGSSTFIPPTCLHQAAHLEQHLFCLSR